MHVCCPWHSGRKFFRAYACSISLCMQRITVHVAYPLCGCACRLYSKTRQKYRLVPPSPQFTVMCAFLACCPSTCSFRRLSSRFSLFVCSLSNACECWRGCSPLGGQSLKKWAVLQRSAAQLPIESAGGSSSNFSSFQSSKGEVSSKQTRHPSFK